MRTEVRPRRPVTPVGIVAGLLASVLARLDAAEPLDDRELRGIQADLRRAETIASGLDPYLEACTTPESSGLALLAAGTAAQDWGGRRSDGGPQLEQEMLSGHVEGTFLQFLVRLMGARRVLEIGMFTGYSALAMAEALPPEGRLVACEIDAYAAGLATGWFASSPAAARIEVEVGPALETLGRLSATGQRFDLVFIDADKSGYRAYLDAVLDGNLLDEGAVICVDNTLMQGEPWTKAESDRSANGCAIADFNAALVSDPRVEQVVIPLRDGITLVRRI